MGDAGCIHRNALIQYHRISFNSGIQYSVVSLTTQLRREKLYFWQMEHYQMYDMETLFIGYHQCSRTLATSNKHCTHTRVGPHATPHPHPALQNTCTIETEITYVSSNYIYDRP